MLKKKMFALASVTTLTGLVLATTGSGCSSKQESSETPEAGPEGGGRDAGGKDAADAGEDPGTGTCPTTTAIDATKLPWKSPTKSPGACTPTDLSNLVSFVDTNDNAKYADWKASVTNMTCRSCIFGTDGATWAPLVENSSGQLVVLNVGGCIAIASGSDACGKSYQNWFDCRFEACAECPDGDTPALQKCLSAASKGACKAAFDAVGTVCGDQQIADAETACEGDKFVFEGPIKAQCIGLDGGTD